MDHRHRARRDFLVGAALALFVAQLVASGTIAYGAAGSPTGSAVWVFAPGGWEQLRMLPAVAVLFGGHWFVFLALVPTALAAIIAGLFGHALALARRADELRCVRRPHLGLLGALPAAFAAPLCCAPSVASLIAAAAGLSAGAILSALVLPLLALTAALLAATVVRLRRALLLADQSGSVKTGKPKG